MYIHWIAILQTSQVYDLCIYNIIVNTEYNSTKIVCEQRRVYREGVNKISLDERSRRAFGKTYFLADYIIFYCKIFSLFLQKGLIPFCCMYFAGCLKIGIKYELYEWHKI